jgi:hypothetical protein
MTDEMGVHTVNISSFVDEMLVLGSIELIELFSYSKNLNYI